MSRCILDNEETGMEVIVGWDPGMKTFFARVADRYGREVFWTGNGDRTYSLPETLVEMIHPYACRHDKSLLLRELRRDRAANDGNRSYTLRLDRPEA